MHSDNAGTAPSAGDREQADTRPERPLLLTPIATWPLGTVLNPLALGRAVRATAGVCLDTVLALPRIATTLERLLPTAATLRDVVKLRGTLDRLERLGGFLAEELPELGHQLEAVRKQLAATENRTDARLELAEAQLRETATAVRTLTEVLRDRLELVEPAPDAAEPRQPEQRSGPPAQNPGPSTRGRGGDYPGTSRGRAGYAS